MKTDIRVTKYNPMLRDSAGKYLKHEWTSYSDVGKYFDGKLFNVAQYYEVENKYIAAIIVFFEVNNVTNVKIENLEKYDTNVRIENKGEIDISKIESGSVISLTDLQIFLKLVLREYLWCELKSPNEDIKVTFGYEYYMYFHSKTNDNVASKIKDIGLYVD